MMSSSHETENENAEYPVFSEPWDFSDLVLVAGKKKFHVHKVGACCSSLDKMIHLQSYW
jgi:hypothetical protein